MDYGVPFHEEESEPEEDGAWPDDGSVEPIDDTPPLLQAALVGDLLTVRRELDAGFDPLFKDRYGRSAIQCVIVRGVNQRTDPVYVYRSTESPTVERHRAAILEALLDAGVPLTSRGPNTWSIAHYAAYYDRPQILDALFKAAGPEAAALANMEAHGWTPLQFAARGAYAECIRLLLRVGADHSRPNSFGRNAMEVAIDYSTNYDTSRVYPLLLAAGATIPPNTNDAYLRKVRAAGGFPAYEKAHRMRLTATFAAKFPRLPVEMVSKVVAFAFHAGYY